MPGSTGHVSPQPMVITTSEDCTASEVRIFGAWAVISIPTSAMASIAAGLRYSAGALPAERTSIAPAARWVRNPAAIWERPALWTQTNNTLGVVTETASFTRWGRRFRRAGHAHGFRSRHGPAASAPYPRSHAARVRRSPTAAPEPRQGRRGRLRGRGRS